MTSRLDLVLAAGKAHAASTGGHAQSHPQAMEHAREMHGLTDLIVNKAIGLHTFRQAFDPDSRLPRRRDAMFRKGVTTTHARLHMSHRPCASLSADAAFECLHSFSRYPQVVRSKWRLCAACCAAELGACSFA